MNQNSRFWKRAAIAFLAINAAGWAVTALRSPRPPAPAPCAYAATNALPAAAASVRVVGNVMIVTNDVTNAVAAPTPLSLYASRIADGPGGAPALFLGFRGNVDPAAIAPYIRIEPECDFEVRHQSTRWKDDILLVGDFPRGSSHTVTVLAGCPADDTRFAPVAEDIVRVFNVPHLSPSANFADPGRHLSPEDGAAVVRVETVNVPSVQLSLRRLRDANLHALVRSTRRRWWATEPNSDDVEDLSGPVFGPVTLDTSAALDETRVVEADLAACLPGGKPRHGVFLATLHSDKTGDQHRLVVLSDIALTARLGDDRLLVWATSISTAKPLAGARVVVVSRSNAVLGETVAGEDGVATFPLRPDRKDDTPLYVTATLGDDTSYLDLEDSSSETDSKLPSALPDDTRHPGDEAYEAFVYAPRDIVRPGETLPVKAVFRDMRGRLPGTFPVALRLVRPDGREAAATNAVLSALGTAEASFAIARDWPTGRWRVSATLPGPADEADELGGLSVKVEEIVPPQIKVAVEPASKGPLAPGSDAAATLRADYLFGAPAAGLSYEARIRFEATPFAPKGWDGYRFGDKARDEGLLRYISLGRNALDDAGRATLTAAVPADFTPPSAATAVFSATVYQPGGRSVSAWATSPVAPVPWYVGLRRAADGELEEGGSAYVDVALVAPDGSPLATNLALQVSLERIDTTWNWRRNDNGDWTWERHVDIHPVAEAARALDVEGGRATLSQTFPRDGEYRLRVADPGTGASTTLDFHVALPGRSWRPAGADGTPFAVSLATDRDAYAPGELVTLSVKAPFAGRALLTLEGDGEWRHRVVELAEAETTLQFPVDDPDVPSLRATLTVVRPDEAVPAGEDAALPKVLRAAGSVLVRVVRPERALDVALDAPAEMLPCGKLAVSARVLSGGRPEAGAEVTFAAVDEGICSLTSFRTPDPLAWANAPRWRHVGQFDIFRRLLPRFGKGRAVADSHIGGGSAALLSQRLNPLGRANRFRLVALWSGTVATDTNGVARAEFDVPEFAGSLRVMAVAVGAARYGSATGKVLVRRPVTVVPTLPRFVAPGDVFDATVEFHNTTDRRALLRFEAAAVAGVPVEGGVAETLLLKPGQNAARTLRFRAARETGVATFLFRVADGARSGAAPYEERVELPVRPAASYETRSVHGILRPGEAFRAADAAGGPLIGATASLSCAAHLGAELGPALDYVVRYPYGCLEQTVSGAFPLLYLRDLAGGIRPDLFRSTLSREYVDAAIARVAAMQRLTGGFTFWMHGDGEIYRWGSLYATHFLVEAKKAGRPVPAETLRAALDHVCALLSNTALDDTRENQELRAYAAFVATLGGREAAARPWTARLFERRANLSRYARACLAAALLSGGRPADATTILGEGDPLAAPDDEGRDFGELLNSPVRDLALVLSVQCDLDPDAPLAAEAAERLLARRSSRGCWDTTQENAMALMALGKYVRATLRAPEGAAPPAGEFRSSPRDDAAAFVLDKEFAWHGATAADDAVLRNTGDAPFRYVFTVAGIPAEPPVAEIREGLAVAREFLDARTGKSLNPRKDGTWEFARGDLVAVRLVVSADAGADQVVVSDLLPAGLEIENPALATSEARPGWMGKKEDDAGWLRNRDIRDDRILLFSGPFSGRREYVYLARVVSAGEFTLPAVEAEAMYAPALRARGLPGKVVVR